MASSRKRITWADLAPAKPAVDTNFVEAAIQFANENPISERLKMQSIVTRMDDLSKAIALVKNLPLEKHSEAYNMFAANWLMGHPPVSEPQRIVIPLFAPYWATIGK